MSDGINRDRQKKPLSNEYLKGYSDRGSLVNWRNNAYSKICNWLGSWLPTNEYKLFVSAAIEYGMRSAVRDEDEGREPPSDWR